jgi:hypothetical protein
MSPTERLPRETEETHEFCKWSCPVSRVRSRMDTSGTQRTNVDVSQLFSLIGPKRCTEFMHEGRQDTGCDANLFQFTFTVTWKGEKKSIIIFSKGILYKRLKTPSPAWMIGTMRR